MSELIPRVTERLLPQFEEKQMTLCLKLSDNLPAVMADEDRVSQILLNLIGNALQYTPDGGVVTIAAHRPETANDSLMEAGSPAHT